MEPTSSIKTHAKGVAIVSRFLAALALFCGLAGTAWAGNPPGLQATTPYLATNATSTRALADRDADVFNVMDYGAKCDGSTDDSAAFNATFAAVRALPHPKLSQVWKIVSPPNRSCYLAEPVNATLLSYSGSEIDFGFIDCATTGQVCIDALGSRFILWRGNIYGDVSHVPSIVLQIGRYSGDSGGSGMVFDQLRLTGYATFTLFYNYAGEVDTYLGMYANNRYTGAGSYSRVFDAYNHFNVQSTFVTVTNPVDSQQSMSLNDSVGTSDTNAAPGNGPIWLGGVYATSFQSPYIGEDSGTTGGVVTFFCESLVCNNQTRFYGLHSEYHQALNGIFVTGTYATPTITGLQIVDSDPLYTGSVIATDTNITAAVLQDADIHIDQFGTGTPGLFSNPSIWNASGNIYLPALADWTEPNSFSGEVCITTTCVHYVPTQVLNRNPDFLIDQVGAGTAVHPPQAQTVFTDGWAVVNSGAAGGNIVFQQQSTGGLPTTALPNFENMTTQTGAALASTAAVALRSTIEGPDIIPLNWGHGNAQPLHVDFWFEAGTTGVYNFYIQNGAQAESFVQEFTVAAVSTWTHYSFVVPGPTSGVWNTTKNNPGMFFGFNMGSGSTFQSPAAETWEAGKYYSTNNTSGVQPSTLTALHMSMAGVHLIQGPFALPYQPRPIATELQIDQHWYSKSFIDSVFPAQNAGAIGAATMVSPYAYTAGLAAMATVSFPVGMYVVNGTTYPTITFYSTGAASANCYDLTKASDAGAATVINEGVRGFTVSCPLVSGDAAGDQLQVQWVANSNF